MCHSEVFFSDSRKALTLNMGVYSYNAEISPVN